MNFLAFFPYPHPVRWRRPGWLCLLVGILGVHIWVGQAAWGAWGPKIFRVKNSSNEGTSTREAQDAALQAIPWERLNASARTKVQEVVSRATLFRRMPLEVIQCEPEFFLFCVHHPEVVVNIWQVLGVTRMTLQPSPQGPYQVDDGMGTQCEVQFIFQSPELHLIYGEGTYEGPLLKRKIYGRGLLVLHSPVRQEANGRTLIACRLDSFLQMEPGALEVLTKTFHPFMGRVSDYNFKQTAQFVEELWECAQRNPTQLERLASRLQGVTPEVRKEFIALMQRATPQSSQLSVVEQVGSLPSPENPPAQHQPVQTGQTPKASLSR